MVDRTRGLLNISANFEPQSAEPFDARMRVKTKASLLLAATWQSSDSNVYTYPGMIAVVYNDTDANNGAYRLKAADYTAAGNWEHITSNDYVDTEVQRVSTGALNATDATSTGVGKLTFAATRVNLRQTTDHSGKIYEYTIPEIELEFIDGATEYVVAEYNGGVPRFVKETNTALLNNSDRIPIWLCWRVGTTVHQMSGDNAGLGLANKISTMLTSTQAYRRAGDSGLMFYETVTPNPRTVAGSGGYIFAGFNGLLVGGYTSATDLLTLATITTGTWSYNSTALVYNNTHYNPTTGPVAADANRWVVRWFYRSIGDIKEVFYVYGLLQHSSRADAKLETPRNDLPNVIRQHCVLVGRAVIQNGDTSGRLDSTWAIPIGHSFVIDHNDTGNINAGDIQHLTVAEKARLDTGLVPYSGASGDVTLGTYKLTAEKMQFNTAPTVGTYAEGKLFYDATWKTLSAECGRNVTLQIGQEDLRRVYNNTGVTILNGQAVYATGVYSGGTNDVSTVALAKADSATTAFLLGCATQDIPDSDYGFVTVRGHVNGLDTNRIGSAYLTTQGMVFDCLVGGTAGNAYTFTVIDTGSAGLSYTEVGGAIIVNLGASTTTRAQLATYINTTSPSAYVRVAVESSGNVIVASVLSFSGGVATAAGDVLYLSAAVPGKLRIGVPDAPNLEIRVGRLITKSATVGRINIRIYQGYRINDLVDVTTTTPAVDEILRYNGSQWVNGTPGSVSAGPGIEFFNCTPVIVSRTSPAGLSQAGTAGNGVQINSLSKTPVTTAEQLQAGQAVSDTRAFVAWLYNTALGRTTIDAGVWDFTTFIGVNSTGGGRVTTLTRNIYQVVPVSSGSVTITNLGANTKTATITSGQFTGTYFAANATNTTASYLQTPSGIYQISAVASVNSVTIIVPTGYVNETSVTFNLWNKLFGSTSPTITAISPAYTQYDTSVTSPAFTVALTDKLGQMGFVTSNNTTTLTVTYNGIARNTHFSTPLVTLHDNLAGLNAVGGNYQHLTDAHHTALTGGGATTLHSHAVPTTITVAAEASDQTCYPLFVTGANGDLAPKTHAAFGFDALNGWLGVGTATPSSKLHVTTTYTNAYGTAVQLFTNTTLTTNGSLYNIGQLIDCSVNNITAGVTDSGYKACLQINNTPSGVGFAGTQTSSIGLLSYSGIGASATAGAIITNVYGAQIANYNLTAGTTVTNSYGVHVNSKNSTVGTITNAWDIYAASATSYNYFAGNVGIGVAAPSNRLHVVNTTSSAIVGYFQGPSGDYVTLCDNSGGQYSIIAYNNIRVLNGHLWVGSLCGLFSISGTLVLGANRVEGARIVTTTNNFLIGTTDDDGTPATGRLVVQGAGTDVNYNIFVGRNSNGANVTTLDCAGLLSTPKLTLAGGSGFPAVLNIKLNPFAAINADDEVIIGDSSYIAEMCLNISHTARLNYGYPTIGRNMSGTHGADTYRALWGTAAGYDGIEFRYATGIYFYSATGTVVKDAAISPVVRMVIEAATGNVLIGSTDDDGTPATGRLVVQGAYTDSTYNIFIGRNSNGANVATLDCAGYFVAAGGLRSDFGYGFGATPTSGVGIYAWHGSANIEIVRSRIASNAPGSIYWTTDKCFSFVDGAGPYLRGSFDMSSGIFSITGGVVLGFDWAGNLANVAGTITFLSAGTHNHYYNTFTSGENTANATYTWPTAMPASSGYVLACTDAGVMSWAAAPAAATMTVVADTTDQTCYPLFVNAATGDLAVKTHAAFGFDALYGRIGVGTAVPSYKLDVREASTQASVTAAGITLTTACTSTAGLDNVALYLDATSLSITAGVTNTNTHSGILNDSRGNVAGFLGTQSYLFGSRTYTGIGPYAGATASISNCYGGGFYCQNQLAGTTIANAYAVHANSKNVATGTITNAWDFYGASATSYNYFAGSVGIGIASPTLAKVHILKATADYLLPALLITGASTTTGAGEAAQGFGLYLTYNTSGNHQMLFAENETGKGVRYIGHTIDGCTVAGARADLVLGSDSHGAHVGIAVAATQFSVSNLSGTASKVVCEIKGAAAQSGNYLNITTDQYTHPGEILQVTSAGDMFLGTYDVDGTPPIGRLVVQGSTNDGTTNIFVGRDSNGANVFLVASNGRTAITTGTYAPIASHLQVGADSDGTLTAGARIPVLLVVGKYNDTDEVSLLRLVRPLQSSQLFAASVDFKMKCWGSLGSPFLPATQLTISLKGNGGYDSSDVFDVITFRDDRTVLIGETTYTQNAARLVIKGSTNNGTTDIFVGLDSDAALVSSLNTNGVFTAIGGLVLGLDAATNTAGYIKMFAAGANAYYNTFTSGENTANANYTLPLAPPTVNGQLMSCTTAGVLSWAVAPKKTIILPAAAAALGTTTPATRETREIGTTARPVVDVLKFAHAAISFAWWKFILPDSYDGGTITAKISYTNIATDSTNKFLFTISAACLADGGPLDVTMGTAVELEATVADTAEDVKIASWGTAITPSGTPAGGQVIIIKLQRDPADTTHDTTSLDAYVLDLAIEYTTNSWTD